MAERFTGSIDRSIWSIRLADTGARRIGHHGFFRSEHRDTLWRAAGEWLDHVVDCAKITALHAAVLVAFYRFFDLPSTAWLLLPLGFQFAAVVIFFGGLLTDKLKPKPAPGTPRPAPSPVRAVALLPVDYGVFCAVFLLLGSETVFRFGYAAFAAVHGHHHFVTPTLQTPRKHIAVHFVVFDKQDFSHSLFRYLSVFTSTACTL